MTFAVNAQLADQPYSVETVMHHEGMVGDTDLTGFTTYRVYIHLQNQYDFVSAIYGDEELIIQFRLVLILPATSINIRMERF